MITTFVYRWLKNAWATPFLLTGIVSLSINAMMLVVEPFVFRSGDATKMIALGVPHQPLFTAGAACLLLSLYFFTGGLPYFGLAPSSSLIKKLFVLVGRVVPYALIVLGVSFWGNQARVPLFVKYLAIVLCALTLAVVIAHKAYPVIFQKSGFAFPVNRRHIAYSLILMTLVFLLIR